MEGTTMTPHPHPLTPRAYEKSGSAARPASWIRRFLGPLLLLLLTACQDAAKTDSPQAAFELWQQASQQRDVEAYFTALVPPHGVEFLMNIIASWRAGEWQADPGRQNALGAVLKSHGLDTLKYPLNFDARARIEGLESLPEVLAELVRSVDGQGPRGVPLWDLLPQPISHGELGPPDNYDSITTTVRYLRFDIDALQQREMTDKITFFRSKDGMWRVSIPGL